MKKIWNPIHSLRNLQTFYEMLIADVLKNVVDPKLLLILFLLGLFETLELVFTYFSVKK